MRSAVGSPSGLLTCATRRGGLEPVLPLLVVALALWSPLAALGPCPSCCAGCSRRRAARALARARGSADLGARARRSAWWSPAYLDARCRPDPKGWTIGRDGFGAAAVALDLVRHVEFFVLEAGLIGAAILAIRASRQVVLALAILALLPLVSFGAANDFVMRVSIPSLTVLAIAACRALTERRAEPVGPHQARRARGTARGGRGHAVSGIRARRVARAVAHQSRRDARRRRVRQLPAALRGASARPALTHSAGRRTRCRPDPEQRPARIPRCASRTRGVTMTRSCAQARLRSRGIAGPRAAGAATAPSHAFREPHRSSRREPLRARRA